jgi:Tfp pilus assembly protein FimV
MFAQGDKLVVGRLLFDAWTDPAFATRLRRNPDEVLAERGIRDIHGRGFVILTDTENTLNLVFPWLPAAIKADLDSAMIAEQVEQQASGLLRVAWTSDENKKIADLLRTGWKDPRQAAGLLEQPKTVLAKALETTPARLSTRLGHRRIVAHEDTAHVIHFVVPVTPTKDIDDLLTLGFELMNSASCLSDDDDD